MLINAGLSAELELQQMQGAGIGLYRTEIPFMLRERFPSGLSSMSFTSRFYRRSAAGITLRTLDVGGDKPPYFPINEENPFWVGVACG